MDSALDGESRTPAFLQFLLELKDSLVRDELRLQNHRSEPPRNDAACLFRRSQNTVIQKAVLADANQKSSCLIGPF